MHCARPFLLAAFSVVAIGCSPPAPDADAGDVQLVDVTSPMDVPHADVQPDVRPAASNATCAHATMLTAGSPIAAEDTSLATQVLTSACYPAGTGKALFYRVTVPAGQTVLVTATPSATLDPVVRFISSCTATACERYDDASGPGVPEVGHWANPGTGATEMIVAVSPYSRTANGTFDLTTSFVPNASGALCDGAALIPSGTTLHGENILLSETGADTRCLPSASGYELFYRVSVPAAQHLTATATPMGTWNPVLRIFGSCAATTCLASGDSAAAGLAETLTYANTGAAAVEVIVAAGSDLASRPGTFDLTLATAL